MSSYLSDIDNIKFQAIISFGDHSPKLNKHILKNHELVASFAITSSFFRELSQAKAKYPEFTYTEIVNTQLQSVQLCFTERLESRLVNKTNKVLRKYKQLTGRKKLAFNSQVHKIVIFSNEVENVYDLNFCLQKFTTDNVEFEHKCNDLISSLQNEVSKSNILLNENKCLSDKVEHLQGSNSKLIDYVKYLQKRVATANNGKCLSEVSENNRSRKIKEIKSQAQTALWFAESYGLVPQSLKLQTVEGENINVCLNQSINQTSSYKDMPSEEKQKIKDLVFILEKFNVSESAYRELTMYSDSLPRKYLVSQCREDINSLFHFERASGNIPGAFLSLEGEIARYIRYHKNDDSDMITIKISGDGSKVSRISNFMVLSFSVVSDELRLSSKDQFVFCIVNCKENYCSLNLACSPVFREINSLYQKGSIDVDGKQFRLQVLFGGDMKFLQIVLGLGGSLCNYCCPWCKIHKDQRDDMTKAWDYYHSEVMFRTTKHLIEDVGKKEFGVREKPLVNIEPFNIVIDELHLLLRICDKLLANLLMDTKTLDDKNGIRGEKTNFIDQLVDKIRECGVSFHIWCKKGSQGELDWSSLTGSEYKKLLENLPSKLFFLVHHETHGQTVNLWESFLVLYRFVTQEIHEFTSPVEVFDKCKNWVVSYLALGKSGRRGYDSVTPYMHCLVYHVPFIASRYGKLVRLSGQGVEKINDEIKKIHHSKTNKWDATLDALQVRKRIEQLASENCEREKRHYSKTSDHYWHEGIFIQRAAKRKKIIDDMSASAAKYLDSSSCVAIPPFDSLSIDQIKSELKNRGIKTRLKSRAKLLDLLKSQYE